MRRRRLGDVIRDTVSRMPTEGFLLSVCRLFFDGYDSLPTWETYSLDEVREQLDNYTPM
jgi:hypothetical protein